MTINELPALLARVGIATEAQATELLRLIEAEEQATLERQYPGEGLTPIPSTAVRR